MGHRGKQIIIIAIILSLCSFAFARAERKHIKPEDSFITDIFQDMAVVLDELFGIDRYKPRIKNEENK